LESQKFNQKKNEWKRMFNDESERNHTLEKKFKEFNDQMTKKIEKLAMEEIALKNENEDLKNHYTILKSKSISRRKYKAMKTKFDAKKMELQTQIQRDRDCSKIIASLQLELEDSKIVNFAAKAALEGNKYLTKAN
jgi:hypothetical protein